MLCHKCVVQHCCELRLEDKMATDQKTITSLLKTPCTRCRSTACACVCTCSTCMNSTSLTGCCSFNVFMLASISSSGFWVGKKSLQCWRKLYLQHQEDGGHSSSASTRGEGEAGQGCNQSRPAPPATSSPKQEVLPAVDSGGGLAEVSNPPTATAATTVAATAAVIVISSEEEDELVDTTVSSNSKEPCSGLACGIKATAPLVGKDHHQSQASELPDSSSEATGVTSPHQPSLAGSPPCSSSIHQTVATTRPSPAPTGGHTEHCADSSSSPACAKAEIPCDTQDSYRADRKSELLKFNSDLLCRHGKRISLWLGTYL